MSKIICADLDGVVFDFNSAYAKLLIKVSGEDKLPRGWKNNPEILAPVWDWDTHWGYSEETQTKVWKEHILPEGTKFWSKLSLVPGVEEALLQLDRLAKKDCSIYFLTQRMGHNAKYQTEIALYAAGIIYPTVILCNAGNKSTIARLLKADIFIDDKLSTVEAVATDAYVPKVYLLDALYNRTDRHINNYTVVTTLREMLELEGLW